MNLEKGGGGWRVSAGKSFLAACWRSLSRVKVCWNRSFHDKIKQCLCFRCKARVQFMATGDQTASETKNTKHLLCMLLHGLYDCWVHPCEIFRFFLKDPKAKTLLLFPVPELSIITCNYCRLYQFSRLKVESWADSIFFFFFKRNSSSILILSLIFLSVISRVFDSRSAECGPLRLHI